MTHTQAYAILEKHGLTLEDVQLEYARENLLGYYGLTNSWSLGPLRSKSLIPAFVEILAHFAAEEDRLEEDSHV